MMKWPSTSISKIAARRLSSPGLAEGIASSRETPVSHRQNQAPVVEHRDELVALGRRHIDDPRLLRQFEVAQPSLGQLAALGTQLFARLGQHLA